MAAPHEKREVSPGELLDLKPGTMCGEYRIDGPLGEGGMATVYAATHPLIGKRGAIKVMSPQLSADAGAVERFVQEARAVNQIGHPNIIDVFAFGTLPDGRSYFVMELLPGETLYARMKREPLKLRETIAILFDVCDALEAAHEKKIVHRDLKPENLFLVNLRNNRKQVKLLDFGVAKLNKESDARVQRTRQDTIIGTPQYLSPEQARAKGVDSRTDIYSLGIMAFEMIVGKPPFDSENVMDILVQHMTTPAPRPSTLRPGLPEAIDGILLQMLDKDADKRPSIDEIRLALSIARDTMATEADGFFGPMEDSGPHGIAAMSRGTPQRITPPPRAVAQPYDSTEAGVAAFDPARKSKLPLFIGIGAVALVGIVFLATRGGKEQPPAPVPAPASPHAVAPSPAPAPAPAPAAAAVKVKLRIKVDAPDATISVDEDVVADRAGSADITLGIAGTHIVEAVAPGRKSARKVLTTVDGDTLDVDLKLPKMASSSSSSSSKPKPASGKKDANYMLDPFAR
jgi:serine/threonine-protein kinase